MLQTAIALKQQNLQKPKTTAFEVFKEFGNAMRSSEDLEIEWAKLVGDARNAQDIEVDAYR